MDGEPPQEEDFSQIPLVDRSQHKNWRARFSAYNDIVSKSAKTASDTDPFFRPYISDGSLLKKWCLDANAVAQEKGVEAVLAIVQYSGESSARTRTDVIPGIVEKALGNSRAGTKKKGGELCAMYMEVENGGEGLIMDILVGLDSKQPKVVAGCVGTLKELVESFGVTAIGNIKPLLKSLFRIFAHSDKTVRAEGTSLAIALYSYIGAALLAALGDLKPLQMSELQKSFDGMDAEGKGTGTGKPTRWTRKTQRDREAADPAGGQGEESGEVQAETPVPIDPLSLLDPIDVLSKFPSDLDERLASTKWKDRLEALEECNKILAQPQSARILSTNVDAYGSLVSTLGSKCKSDANINVVIEAAKVLEGLAKGMGKPFGRQRAVMMSGCLDRLKERKATVVEALGKALDAIFSTTSLSDVTDEVLSSLKSKNPQVKEGTLKFLHRSLQTTTDGPGKDQVKPMAETLVSLLGDSLEPVRTSAAECLGTLMKILGERAFNPYIEGVGELQMAKVKDAFEKAEIRYRAGGAAKGAAAGGPTSAGAVKKAPQPKVAPPPSSPPIRAAAPPSSPIRASVTSSPPARAVASGSPPIKASGRFDWDDLESGFGQSAKPPSTKPTQPAASPPTLPFAILKQLQAAKPASSAPTAASKPSAPVKKPPPSAAAGPSKPPTGAKPGSSKTLAVSPSEPAKYRFTAEDAAAQAVDVIPADYHTKLADAAWKVRLEAAEAMVKWVEAEGGAEKVDSEVMIRFLGKTPGWGEKNFQVSAKLYQVMGLMAEKSPSFAKPAAALVIGPLSDRLGDLKLRKPAGDAMTAFAEKTSLAFVLAQAYESMTKQKAPKAQADALLWIKQQLTDFGIAGIPLRDLISFVKCGLQSPNALVRSSATQVLVTVRIFVGADISGFLEDLNPQLLMTINSEFDKVAGQTPPEPTRTSKDLQNAVAGPGKAAGKAGGADLLDDLIPRLDLDKLVAQTSVVADSKSDAWKARKEAFESLNSLLEVKSNSRLKANMGEIGGVLKKAMADTNLSVKMLALGIISKIALGMGQPFDKHTRLLTARVASVCADQKATTRTAAVTTLAAMADATGGLGSMYAGLASSLESTNPALRASVLAWIAERLQAEPPASDSDMTPLAAPIISCLEDRNGDVRKSATAILPFVVANAGFDFVMDQTSILKPASKATIVPLINNARASPATTAAVQPAVAPAADVSKAVKPPTGRTSTPNSPVRAPAAPAKSVIPPARSLAMKALSSVPTSRSVSSLSQGDDRPTTLPTARMTIAARPASASSNAPATASPSHAAPFTTSSTDGRVARLKKDATRWLLEAGPKGDLSEYLASQMEPHTSPEVFSLLFSKDHRAEEDYMSGLTGIAQFYEDSTAKKLGMSDDEVQAIQLANVDLALKYSALKLLSNNTQLANRCLEVMTHVVETLPKFNERFSDAEAKLFVPALIIKLGDPKFGPKLVPIFESLDKIIAGSQVVQLLVQYGLEDKSAGRTCKNESLQLIEKAYKKRGSILRTKDDRGFYEAVARCVADSGTRNAALSLLALLQLQGGSASLRTVVDTMPSSSKDMLANRRAALATTKTGPVVARVTAEALAEASTSSPVRPMRLAGTATPVISRLPRESVRTSFENSPAIKGTPRGGASPSTRHQVSPSTSRTVPAPSALPRGNAAAAAAQSRLQRPSEVYGAITKPSMQPLTRGLATRPLSNGHTNGHYDRVTAAINDIRHDHPNRSVDALKHLQVLLADEPDSFLDNVQTITDALVDEMERAFTPPDNLLDPRCFRLVKHLIQTFSGFSENQNLMRRLSYSDIYSMLSGLSLRLVQADRMGGTISELVKFMNMILVQLLATPDRLLVFTVMFRLFLSLSKDFFVDRVQPETEVAAHADLVLKCLWKRCKILDDDLRSGRLKPGPMMAVIEEFLQAVGPAEYRRRAAKGVALGDMPLRTVKTIIQRIIIFATETNQEIYDILLAEFGDEAAETIVYTYVFRLVGQEPNPPQATNRSDGAGSSLPVSAASHVPSDRSEPSPPPKTDSAAEQLVRNLRTGGQASQLDALHAFVKANPDQEANVQSAIAAQLSDTIQIYVRRMLEQRKSGGDPSPSRPEHPISPTRRESYPSKALPRRSLAPRPSSVVVDKGAPIDDQIAHFKNIFTRASQSHEGSPNGNGSGEPLSEIMPQSLAVDVD